MTTIPDKFLVTKKFDRRIKYTDEDKKRIIQLHKKGLSQNAIAKEIGCSRRLVIFTIYPERLARNRAIHIPKKYTKEEWTKLMREHRQYKKILMKNGNVLRSSSYKKWKHGVAPTKDPKYIPLVKWLQAHRKYKEIVSVFNRTPSRLNRKQIDYLVMKFSNGTLL